MIPPNQNVQQAQQITRSMASQQDPLLAALSKQKFMGEAIKQTADHKLKMHKLKQNYQKSMGGGQAPQQNGGY